MAGSSPAGRGSYQWSSPERSRLLSILTDDRNTELSHQDALAAAQAEHDRVRETALRVYHEYELEEENKRVLEKQKRILELQKKEEERIRHEEQLRAEEERLRALKLTTVPKLPPEPPAPEPAPATAPANKSTTAQTPTQSTPTTNHQAAPSTKASLFGLAQPASVNGLTAQVNGASTPKSAQPQQPKPSQTASQGLASPFAPTSAVNPFLRTAAPQQNGLSTSAPLKPQVVPEVDRYIEIHRNLKKLRLSLAQQAKVSPPLKQRMGDMRRELRKNMGQLVGEKGGNRKQITAIQALLNESLSGTVPSELIDPHDFITDKREPVEGATHNGPQLPSLFIYLLNHFSKSIINQFINECGAQPKSADPIGVITAMMFSNKAYLWRGKTLIDILMAKFRVVCPVLFGYRGSEKTEQGRLRLGWKKDGPGWTDEQQHIDRMKGLGVGYAAISLRDFSKSPNANPWPPSKYWTSMAKIVNTPPAEISNTQCVVLRAMIEICEERFLHFYGSAAIAALRKALVEFPAKAEAKTPGVSGLQVLAQIFKRDMGLEL
ncbi:GLE1-domain-containing protein [Whalleya microplaca]|nr:GLE1-domain-containing protein [Whalleya microplaca]